MKTHENLKYEADDVGVGTKEACCPASDIRAALSYTSINQDSCMDLHRPLLIHVFKAMFTPVKLQ